MEPTQPSRPVPVLVRFQSLLIGFSSKCPQATDVEFTRAWFRIDMRWRHLNLVLQRIDDDIELLKKARRGSLEHSQHEMLVAAPSLDVEVLYTVLRSLLDDVAALTPCFYSRQKSMPARHSLNKQLTWYRNNPQFDPAMTDYAQNNVAWFIDLRDTRDDLVHRHCDVLTSNSGEETAEGDIPVEYAIVKLPGLSAPRGIEAGVRSMLQSVLAFPDFYSSHFVGRLPNDRPDCATPGLFSSKGAVHGVESLKRWTDEEIAPT